MRPQRACRQGQLPGRNLFAANISQATVVTLYLLQSLNERFRPKLVREELKPGTRDGVPRVQHGTGMAAGKDDYDRQQPHLSVDHL